MATIDGVGTMSWPSARERMMRPADAGSDFASELKSYDLKGFAAPGMDAMAAASGATNGAANGAANGSTGGTAGGNTGGTNAGAAGATTGASSGSASSGAGTSVQTAQDTEDRFLKLLVAQMRNQDPLNPMDNAAVTSQMAQISTVRGIETLNTAMSNWMNTSGPNSLSSNLAVVGHQVLSAGEKFDHGQGAQRLGIELGSEAQSATVEIVDAGGRVVATRTIDKPSAGMSTFEWDGRDDRGNVVPAGPMRMRVSATDGKAAVQASALVPARVVGVAQGQKGAQLQLDNGTSIAPTDIRLVI